MAGTIGYCVGALNLPQHKFPYEDASFNYPSNMASPSAILVEGSNGCSDYGNKFGEPLICGFTRSFGMRTVNPHPPPCLAIGGRPAPPSLAIGGRTHQPSALKHPMLVPLSCYLSSFAPSPQNPDRCDQGTTGMR